ncbi:MAG: DegV family protein [Oscillospiraceae bacterium]|nr:DegV family protein [Oscillospiraceae bacterium]
MKRRIVSDSSANMQVWTGMDFVSVPLKIIAGEREYVDDASLDLPRMLDELQDYKGKSGTSCPNVADWLDAFQGADEIFALTITSALSGSYSTAVQAQAEYKELLPEAKVMVLDTLSTGPEMVLIMEKIQELTEAGRSFEETEAAVREYSRHTHLFFALESMKNLANNGRVNHTVAALAGLLGIRVLGAASEEGTLLPLHNGRGWKRTFRAILDELEKYGYAGGKLRIAHCQNLTAAEELAEMITRQFGKCDISIHPCTGLCAFYAERGGLMVGFEGV